ncbi:MAG: ubiquinone/menaquinone biosynthesis methyltransferase [Bacteroidales bacterium]|nr:ubiquinone/menaquinone biosynthesis methyltransferase [Bacteroidales bacterium]
MKDFQEDFPLHAFYGDIHSTYDRVNRIFTFGRDRSWRRRAARELLQNRPGRVLDLCTGTGDFVLELAHQSAHASNEVDLTGFDFSSDMLKEAQRKQSEPQNRKRLPQIRFIEGDAGEMPFEDDHFDSMGITFGIRNLVYENSNASKHLSEMKRVLRPGGQLVVLESSKPKSPLWRLFNDFYLRFILPYLGGLISGNLKAYQYLSRSSKNYYTIGEMGVLLEVAGFKMIRSRSLFLGSVMLLVLEKR